MALSNVSSYGGAATTCMRRYRAEEGGAPWDCARSSLRSSQNLSYFTMQEKSSQTIVNQISQLWDRSSRIRGREKQYDFSVCSYSESQMNSLMGQIRKEEIQQLLRACGFIFKKVPGKEASLRRCRSYLIDLCVWVLYIREGLPPSIRGITKSTDELIASPRELVGFLQKVRDYYCVLAMPSEVKISEDQPLKNQADDIRRWLQGKKFEGKISSVLGLRNRSLPFIPLELCLLSSVRVLDLSGNRICEIPEEFAAMKALKNVTLTGNPVAKRSECIRDLYNRMLPSLVRVEVGCGLYKKPSTYICSALRNPWF